MKLYIVTLYSTGERWHTMVCKDFAAVDESLSLSYGMTLEYGYPSAEYLDYRNHSDLSQTATAQLVTLIE